MKAILATKYGPPNILKITDIPKPVISDNEILVKTNVVAVTTADIRIRSARFPKGFGLLARLAFGITKPRQPVLGSAFSGVVEAVGKHVTEYEPGTEVCGLTGMKMGAYAEYIKIDPRKSTAVKSRAISHEEAAGMLFGGTAALYFLRDKLRTTSGDSIIINGASGAVGTNAVQLAKHFGATVAAVARGNNTKLLTRLGASKVIDYTKQSLISSETTFDIVLDTVGNISPETAKKLLNLHGRAGLMVGSLWEMMRMRGNVKGGTATEKKADIEFLLSLMEQGKLKSIVDSIFDFEQIVAAHEYAERNHKSGVILLKI